MTRSTVLTKKAPAPIGPYSQGIVAKGSFLFTAGQVAIDPATGQLAAGDVKAQTRQVMNNLTAVLKEAGSSMERVVKTTVYLKDMNEFSMMNEVYGEFFPANPPARSTVEVARLPKDAKVEIDVVALIDPA
jgi:2-iminobutanoate/2-iminopropanoate deaminase